MNQRSSIPSQQQGAALIVVLLFLILIVLAGGIAVKNSTTDLKVATSEQAGVLLLNTADNTNKSVEQIINIKLSDEQAKIQKNLALSSAGMFGYFMNVGAEENRGDQIVFCYRPQADYFFRMNKATVLDPTGRSKLAMGSSTTEGFCRVGNAEDYSSSRNNVITQVAITRPTSGMTATEPFEYVPLERSVSTSNVTSSSPNFRLFSTSFLPAMSQADNDDILACLKKPNENAADYYGDTKKVNNNDTTTYYDETLTQCLARIGVPAKTLVEDIKMENLLTSKQCLKYGNKGDKISAECQMLLNVKENGAPK